MSLEINPRLNLPQARFLGLPHKYRAFVAGFGTGKTWVGCAAICGHAWEWPGVTGGYFAPTYPHIHDIFYPTIEEVAHDWGLRVKIAQARHEVHFYSAGRYRNTVICRSMEDPGNIAGFKIGHAMTDELDLLKTPKAQLAWRKIQARMRFKKDGLRNGIDVTTTPEGFRFVYEMFVKAVRDRPELAASYGMIQASTYENGKNLPDDYIPGLLTSYPPQLVKAYIRGMFTNLTSGSVYPNFDRLAQHTDAVEAPNEPLHVGMDFNVLKMAAAINVLRDGRPVTVRERANVRDTPSMIALLKRDFESKGHTITVYPDASGQNTSSKNASESDLSLLRQAGFTVTVDGTNPAVKDRINSVDAMTLNAQGVRRWRINTHTCPKLTEAQEQQAYDEHGDPDKTTGHDHLNDAQGYFLTRMFPVIHRPVLITPLRM